MRFRITHVTRFKYERPAYESHNEVRLKPRQAPNQRTLGFSLQVTPPASVVEYLDAFENIVHAISVHDPHGELIVRADSLVERTPALTTEGILPFSEFLAGDGLRSREEYDFLHQSRYIPFSERLKRLFWSSRARMDEPVTDYARRIVQWVRDQFEYEPGATTVHSDINQILRTGGGVCQDFAHLAIGILRLAGVPARYVSGYLAPRDRARPLGSQASHAWLEALLPESGWTGFDPTHGCLTNDYYVRIAVGRDYADVPPLHGVYRSAGGNQTMGISVEISDAGDDSAGSDRGATQQ